MARHSVIIDTDPGIDDAMAIFYALSSPEIDVLGLTTVYGNVAVDLSTENALRVLEVAGAPDIPVTRGAARPLSRPYRGPADFVHGRDGRGEVHLPPPTVKPKAQRATEFIIETIASRPGDVTLVTLGPLTNLALVLLERPETAYQVREVVAMGGNVHVPGNASAAGEANILNDPEAADLVLSAPWPVTLCGLDVTHRITMSPEDLERIYRVDNAICRYLSKIVPFYHAFYQAHTGGSGIYVHDSTTISYLLHPQIFSVEKVPVRVDTSDGIGRGKTWPSKDGERPEVTVCIDVDGRAAVEYELAALDRRE